MLRYLAYNNIPYGWSLGLKGTVGHEVVPSLYWVFQPLTTTSSSWPQHPPVDRLVVTGQVTAPLLQAFSLVPLSYAGTNRRLSLLLLPAYELLPSPSCPSLHPLSSDSTQAWLEILEIQLSLTTAKLLTPYPGVFGKVAGICHFSSLQLLPKTH